jgi:hypothetical protein
VGAIVAFGRRKAFLREGTWRCPDQALERQLNDVTEAWILETGGPALEDIDPERAVALEMARRIGGEVLFTASPRTRRAQRVYFQRRQFRLAF